MYSIVKVCLKLAEEDLLESLMFLFHTRANFKTTATVSKALECSTQQSSIEPLTSIRTATMSASQRSVCMQYQMRYTHGHAQNSQLVNCRTHVKKGNERYGTSMSEHKKKRRLIDANSV